MINCIVGRASQTGDTKPSKYEQARKCINKKNCYELVQIFSSILLHKSCFKKVICVSMIGCLATLAVVLAIFIAIVKLVLLKHLWAFLECLSQF